MNTHLGIIRLSAAVLVLVGLSACSQDFWDRSPRVGGQVQPSPYAATPAPPAPAAPYARSAPSPCLPAPQVFQGPPVATYDARPSCGPSAEEQDVFRRVNQIRCARGLRALQWHSRLQVAARDHSAEQQTHGYMGHDSPDPARRTLVQRMQLAGYQGVMYGEVVAWGYRDAASVVEGWMNSPEHRAILVDGQLVEVGFSRVGEYWTGNFGAPRAQRAPVAPRAPRAPVVQRTPRATAAPYVPAPRTYTPPPAAIRTPPPCSTPAPAARRYVPPAPAPVPAPRPSRAPARGG